MERIDLSEKNKGEIKQLFKDRGFEPRPTDTKEGKEHKEDL